jgi:carbamoyl-phosphate synthase large subunit
MRSTGEVMGIGKTFIEAFEKAEIAAGVQIPKSGPSRQLLAQEERQRAPREAKTHSLNTCGY